MLYCRCETASLALRKEQRLRLFVDMVQMKIFGFKWWHVMGVCRRLYSEELAS